MNLKIFQNYYNGENTYLLFDDNSNGALIDPGFGADKLISFLEDNNIKLRYVFLTHCHFDHISDLPSLREKLDFKIVCSDNCNDNLYNENINLSEVGLGFKIKERADIILSDNEVFELFGEDLKCIYTPGHTNCSVCYILNNNLFSGDTLFLRSVGRSDFPTGDSIILEKSIKEKIYSISDNLDVYPGHGDKTSIDYEKKFNLVIR